MSQDRPGREGFNNLVEVEVIVVVATFKVVESLECGPRKHGAATRRRSPLDFCQKADGILDAMPTTGMVSTTVAWLFDAGVQRPVWG